MLSEIEFALKLTQHRCCKEEGGASYLNEELLADRRDMAANAVERETELLGEINSLNARIAEGQQLLADLQRDLDDSQRLRRNASAAVVLAQERITELEAQLGAERQAGQEGEEREGTLRPLVDELLYYIRHPRRHLLADLSKRAETALTQPAGQGVELVRDLLAHVRKAHAACVFGPYVKTSETCKACAGHALCTEEAELLDRADALWGATYENVHSRE